MAKTTVRADYLLDTHVSNNSAYKDTNYWDSTNLKIKSATSSDDYRCFFQMSPVVIPPKKSITKITLNLYMQNSAAKVFTIDKLLDSLKIKEVTWNKSPNIGASYSLGEIPIITTRAWQAFDLTGKLTLEELSTGFSIGTQGWTNADAYSRELLMDAPYIEIEYADAPSRPSVVGPLSGTAIDKTVTPTSRFEWAHNPSDVSQLPQKSYELQWSTDAYTWTTLTETTANAYADVDVSVMSAGAIIWRVRTIDTDDVPSDWSEQQIIRIASIPAAPNILNAVFDKASPKIEWTIAEQSGYQIQILQGAEKLIDTTVTTADKFFNVPIVLANETQFTVRVRCKNNSDVYSEWAEDAISTAYTAPTIPTLSIVKKKYSVELNITGDAPLYQIYRDTVLIGTTATSKYEDWSAPFGVECDYKVVAAGEGTAESAVVKGTTDYPNESVLTLVSDPTKTFVVKWNITYSRDITDDGVLIEYAGRKLPCLEKGEHIARTYTIDAHLTDMTTYKSLEDMVENHSLFLFRRKDLTMYGRPTNIVAAKPDYMRNDFTLSFVLNEVES